MSLLYVFAASPMEVEPIVKAAAARAADSELPMQCGPNDVRLVISGMGPRNASIKAEAALEAVRHASVASKPDAVLVIGLCGGLTESWPESRIVAYTACGSTDASNPALRCSGGIVDGIVEVLGCAGIRCDRVVGITSAHIATTREARIALANSGAAVVDMESYAIMEAALRAGLPAAVVRIVADSMDRVLPDLNRALNESGELDRRKALMVALGSPFRTARLLAANKRAMQNFAKALEIVVKAPCFVSASR